MRSKQKFFFKGIDNEMALTLSVRRWLWKQYRAAPNSSQVVWVHWCAVVFWFCIVRLHPLLFDARWLYFTVIMQHFPELAQILSSPFVVTVYFLFAWILVHVLLLYFCHPVYTVRIRDVCKECAYNSLSSYVFFVIFCK